MGQLLTSSAVPRMTPAIREARTSPGRPVPHMRGTRLTWSPTIREAGHRTGGSAPSAEALRPLARALVALALEVRAEGLALGEPWRSDGPTGKGGGRCVA